LFVQDSIDRISWINDNNLLMIFPADWDDQMSIKLESVLLFVLLFWIQKTRSNHDHFGV
jgi:hypothetical protein